MKKIKLKTAHNKISLNQQQQRLELRSHDNALQAVIDLEAPHRLQLKNLEYLMAVLMFIPSPKRVLVLGTAAGALIHFLRHHYCQAEITAVDIDAELIEKLLEMRVLPPAGDGLSYVYDDATHFIDNCHQEYDLILVDIFIGAQSPAWLLQTVGIERLHRLVSADGALAYNLIISSPHEFQNFYRRLRRRFSNQTLCLPVAGFENIIAYAICHRVPLRDMSWYQLHAQQQTDVLGFDLVQVMSVIYNTNPSGHGII